jgi:EmrB/QacA subfamily drug resistance transporter
VSNLSRRRRRAAGAIVCLATAMLCLDVAVVNTALPSMARDLHSSLSGVQWVIDAYTLPLAAFVLSAGSIADRRGRRRAFTFGMAVFTAASLACALARSFVFLDAARAVQGLGGAVLFATSLAILADAFPEARERAGAMAAYGATIGGSYVIGPAAGGALTSWFGWQSVFYLNVPLGVGAVLGTHLWLPESRDPRARKLDWPGLITLSAGLLFLVLALLRGNGWGSPATLAELGVGGVLLLAFVITEHLVPAPMLPLGLFGRRDFTAAQVSAFTVSAGFFALYLYVTLYLQDVLGLSVIRASLALLPSTLVLLMVSAASARLLGRLAPGPILSIGLLLVGGGVALIAIVGTRSSWTAILPGLSLASAGMGLVNPAQAMLALGSGPPEDSGLLAGAASTFRNSGLAVGVAAFGTLLPAAAALGHGSPGAYVTALHRVLFAGAALSVAGALAVGWLAGIRNAAPAPGAAAEPVPAEARLRLNLTPRPQTARTGETAAIRYYGKPFFDCIAIERTPPGGILSATRGTCSSGV